MMFKTKCGNPKCDKIVFTFALNRQGDLPVVYCSRKCEGMVKHERQLVSTK